MKTCSIDGCGNKHYAIGLCEKHYKRLRKTGTLEDGYKSRGTLQERFFKYVTEKPEDGCWPWQGVKGRTGYGFISAGSKGEGTRLAHRVSYEIHKGEIPAGMIVMHSCDNRACVNPSHLTVGNQSENIVDAFNKGRMKSPIAYGENNPKSKLTQEQVDFIRAHPEMQHKQLADMWGLSPNCIRGVRIGRTWKNY